MASVWKEVWIAAPSDAVWDAVRDAGALHTRLVPGFVTDTQLEPGARVVTFANGMSVRELILDIDDTQRRIAWSAVGTQMTHHNGSFQVFDDDRGGTRGVWIADLMPDEMAPVMADMMEQGLAAMKAAFGKGSGMSDLKSAMARHTGGCHCGAVRYVNVDTSTASACNCSICTKLGVLSALVKPDDFILTTDRSQLASYSRMPEIANRFFCAHCFIYCFSRGHLAELGGDFVSINLNTVDDFDVSQTTCVYWDGRHDNWQAGTRSRPWPVTSQVPRSAR